MKKKDCMIEYNCLVEHVGAAFHEKASSIRASSILVLLSIAATSLVMI